MTPNDLTETGFTNNTQTHDPRFLSNEYKGKFH